MDSSPLPIPTFQSLDEPCPKHLLDFLLNFIQLATHQSPEALLHNSRKRWLSAFDTLNRSFLKPLELPEQFGWHMLHERTKLFEVTFELLYLLTTRCGEVLSYQENLTKSMLCKLLDIASSLEVWLDVPDIPPQEDFPSPEKLYTDCVKTISAMLYALAGCTKIDHEGRAGWQILRSVGEDCLASCAEILAAPPDALYHIRLFEHPKIRTGRPPYPAAEDAAAGSPSTSGPNNYLEHAFICVHSPGQTPLMLTLLLELLLNTLNARHLEQTFIKSLTVRTAEVTCRVYDFLISPACLTSDVKRARAMTRLVNAVCTALQSLEPFNAIADPMRLHLLIRRLNDGPSDAWTKSDVLLVHAFSSPFSQPAGRPDVLSVLMLLKDEQWGDEGQDLRSLASAYLQAVVQTLDERTLAEVAAFLSDRADNASYAGLRVALNARAARAAAPQDVEMADDTNDWRREVREIVRAIVQPAELDWMDDDGGLDDVQFVKRALTVIDRRFGLIYNPSAPARLALLQQLVQLPCALTRHASARCFATTPTIGANTLRACLTVLGCALEGPEKEVTPHVRKAGYDALARTLRHQPSGYCSKRLMQAMDVMRKGMKDVDRNVRMSAGRCLVELVNVYLRFPVDPETAIDNLFKRIQDLLDTGQERWKEAIVLSLGQMAKTSSTYVLGKVLYCLVNQFGCSNPILRGMVSMQLAAAAKYHKKPAFNLLAPYLDTLAPRMVTQLKKCPSMLLEVCNFVCSAPQDFLVLLLPHTLPALYARCDRETLETLAHELRSGAAQLIVENGYKILPHVLLLSAPGQTRRAIDFMLSFFPRSVTVKDILQGHTTETAIALILLMGEDDPATVHDAKDGLTKMQQFLDDTSYTDTDGAIRICLDEQFLAVMNRLTDHLQGSRPIDKKSRVIKALREIILVLGSNVVVFAPQIMATMQTALNLPDLAEATLKTWDTFFRVSKKEDLGSYVRATSAGFVTAWPKFSPEAKELATNCLEFVLAHTGNMDAYKRDIVDLSSIPELKRIWDRVLKSRANMTPHDRFTMLLDRITSDNAAVILLALQELKNFLLAEDERLIRGLTSGDMFDPLVGKIIPVLFSIAGKDHEGADGMRLLALECIGICGAVDPDRFACDVQDSRMTVRNNFEDEDECITFALHVMGDMLVPAFRSTYDIAYQNTLAYIIQQLARFCRFTRSLVQDGPGGSLPVRTRQRWNALPRSVRDVVGPLIESKYSWAPEPSAGLVQPPIYPARATYREWLQEWTRTLIARATGVHAPQIFAAFRPILDSQVKDVTVAYHIFPHLVLNGILSANEVYVDDIRAEILAVLEDQVNPQSTSTVEKRELCAQAIFMLMDHLNGWIHSMRQDMTTTRKKNAGQPSVETRILQVESVLTSIDRGLIAKAALRCKAYARALMCYEQQVWDMGGLDSESDAKNIALETLHEIYAQLDEPDGMEGVSAKILSPSLEHQIREHESTGRWTSAQSCWEVRLQQSPGDLESHLGLLRCLRNLGHYDTMRTHVEGLLVRHPAWQAELIEYQVESGCIIGDWPTVQSLVEQTKQMTSPILLAQVLLAMRSGNEAAVRSALQGARRILGSPITAAGVRGYRHSYPAVLDLHILHELQIIFAQGHLGNAWRDFDSRLESLQHLLAQRLDSTLPTFRYREPVLSIRRTALSLQIDRSQRFRESIGRSWLLTARLARKAGYKQTAYSALLQAQQLDAPYWFVQSAKLSKAMGDPLRAVHDIESWLGRIKAAPMPMTQGLSAELTLVRSKVTTLRARWLAEVDRYDREFVLEIFKEANKIASDRESGHFYLGWFHDECAKALKPPIKLSDADEKAYKAEVHQYLTQRLTMNVSTIRTLTKACSTGTKYIYQALPRALTLFFNVGDDFEDAYTHEIFKTIVTCMVIAAKEIPSYKWYIAFPQIISRIVHPQKETFNFLKSLIRKVIQDHPNQALWQFTSALQSKEEDRRIRAEEVLRLVKASGSRSGVATLVEANVNLAKQLLKLCERPIPDQKYKLTMRQHFSFLANVTPSPCIIPLQESLIAAMPTSPSLNADHQPFPTDAPTFHQFQDEVEIMNSLAKPRKITIVGSDGRQYSFLGKPKDDLRKDARIMDFNAVINKQLKANANTRRRQMYIRTYGVVTLNEECGFIQWVPNTLPVRTALIDAYKPHGLSIWILTQNDKMKRLYDQVTTAKDDKVAAELFQIILKEIPPVLHEWFLHMFPEPTKWLSTRLAYTRTSAVMCMVGWILGMGDRHGENLLLDTRTGDIVHVDFNCLFDKGRRLLTPEKVPFRMTQNTVTGFGVTGTEGVFRIACELALQTLRDNRECLMTILDAFIHDPLVEWYDLKKVKDAERRKEEEQRRRQEARRRKDGDSDQQDNNEPEEVNLEELARSALEDISKKLRGVYSNSQKRLSEKEIPSSSLAGMLITEAMDPKNLARMYPGWGPHL
ncbi:serine/threonine-protein kinase [Phanerochaete sordida]|uniref:Serine/threonine-protein kinase MEC1 n=1 Tax=Phanerochaete sordida TaxID=48140 RepID=A0A9P3FZ58_9APHY|nr:serine/threonine-protein kinase [Phanerochaete sordida]